MPKIIIGNWKMNPPTLAEAQALFGSVVREITHDPTYLDVVICPPFIYLEELVKIRAVPDLRYGNLPLVKIGAQDIFWEPAGAYTGEISAEMLKSFSVSHVLIGHSDRRYILGESDEIINRKIKAALAAEITPVLFVGEREITDVREDALVDQLSRDLENLSPDHIAKILFVYEPVWAISTRAHGRPDTPENTLGAVQIINEVLMKSFKMSGGVPILYGGSINENNVAAFLSRPEISGAVIGGASIRAEEFGRILKLAALIR